MQTRITLPALATLALLPGFLAMPGWSNPARLSTPAIQDDDEDDEAAFALELGRRTFEGNCLMCHSSSMVEGLRLTPEQWAAEVDKMIGWGSPVPPEEKDRLVAFLVTSYPTEAEPTELPRLTLAEAIIPTQAEPNGEALPSGDADRGAALFAQHCTTCHAPDGRGGDLGLNLIARPVLNRPAEYAQVLIDGRRRMPGFRIVLNPEQMADTLAWLQSQSK